MKDGNGRYRMDANRDIERAVGAIHAHDHVCLIYETREQQLAAAIPYVSSALARGERSIYIADENTVDEVLGALREAGIDAGSEVAAGRLQVMTKRESYLAEGSFDPDKMMAFLDTATQAASDAGFEALAVTGEMSWILECDSTIDQLFRYEAMLNDYIPAQAIHAI
jgi:KaiC/GvpD/RAD55 family RecA-like ATPase